MSIYSFYNTSKPSAYLSNTYSIEEEEDLNNREDNNDKLLVLDNSRSLTIIYIK